jgi:lipopolysaccharide/colanic/teichoic acid biosynthesis glycosyltransferase
MTSYRLSLFIAKKIFLCKKQRLLRKLTVSKIKSKKYLLRLSFDIVFAYIVVLLLCCLSHLCFLRATYDRDPCPSEFP